MANMKEKFQNIWKALDYLDNPGLYFDGKPSECNHKSFVFDQIRKKLDIDATYFVKDTPIIYFKYFDNVSEQQIIDLHTKVWNQGTTPLLFVLLPNELRIYSSYKAPVLEKKEIKIEEALLVKFENITSAEAISTELKDFARIEIDSGHFWCVYSKEFSNDKRISQVLLYSLKELRKELSATGLDYEIIHSLIGRSILMLSLEKKGVLDSNFFLKYNKEGNSYLDLLSSKPKLYKAFSDLTEAFGEDLFPVNEEERKVVTIKHLRIIKDILSAKDDNNKLFWAFSFDVIPVELICSIYEEFLYGEDKDSEIASYTPAALAQIMLNQVLPYEGTDINIKILDPACGSSIFLVEAFKRLIEKWVLNNKKAPSFKDLYSILRNSIYGFDCKKEALMFTLFNLYMVMLEYVDKIDLDKPPKFASLLEKNLSECDFFDKKSKLHKNKYDIIIGNPPWQSNYGDLAKDYLKATKYPVGDKQISQVFLWQAGDLIDEDGKICLLMPSKGLLYNFNPKNIEFREKFFKSFDIKNIINLSLFSNLLFENSKFPATIIVYSKEKEGKTGTSCSYFTPKPSHKAWEFATLVIDPSEIKKLPKQQVMKNQHIWKIAFVGSGRDFVLANHLDTNFPKIEYFCEDMEWKYGEGFQLGGGDKNINNDMANMLYIPAKSIFPFFLDKAELDKLGTNTFHRPRDFDLYKAPHTLVRGGQIYAAYIDYDAVFTHAVMSFSSKNPDDAKLLKLLAAYLNSSLVLYYLFLTSSTWCIERTDIHLAEYRTLPFAVPSDEKLLDNILSVYDEISVVVSKNTKRFPQDKEYLKLKSKLDNYIFDIFGLNDDQRQLIVDANDYSINYFQDYSKSARSKTLPESLTKSTLEMLKSFANRFTNSVNKRITKYNYKIKATIYPGNLPLEVMAFRVVKADNGSRDVELIDNPLEQAKVLKKLDEIVLKQTGQSLYITRNLRVFEGDVFYLVKPAEKRYWTDSMALNDADKNVKEILKGFKK